MWTSDKDKGLLRTFAKPFEESYADNEPTLQFRVIDLHCSDDFRSKFKDSNLFTISENLPKDRYQNL